MIRPHRREYGLADARVQKLQLLDQETRAVERPSDHKEELRLWLRLLTCTTLIEDEIRRRLRSKFAVTLPRFDLLAQLEKAPIGLTLGELSQRLMVSNGNVTGLVEALVSEGIVTRNAAPSDRRYTLVSLTKKGRALFSEMAKAHGDWIGDIFADLSGQERATLMRLLDKTKRSTRAAIAAGPGGMEGS
jgi:DNA-binding MarR family transcriptional regulator